MDKRAAGASHESRADQYGFLHLEGLEAHFWMHASLKPDNPFHHMLRYYKAMGHDTKAIALSDNSGQQAFILGKGKDYACGMMRPHMIGRDLFEKAVTYLPSDINITGPSGMLDIMARSWRRLYQRSASCMREDSLWQRPASIAPSLPRGMTLASDMAPEIAADEMSFCFLRACALVKPVAEFKAYLETHDAMLHRPEGRVTEAFQLLTKLDHSSDVMMGSAFATSNETGAPLLGAICQSYFNVFAMARQNDLLMNARLSDYGFKKQANFSTYYLAP